MHLVASESVKSAVSPRKQDASCISRSFFVGRPNFPARQFERAVHSMILRPESFKPSLDFSCGSSYRATSNMHAKREADVSHGSKSTGLRSAYLYENNPESSLQACSENLLVLGNSLLGLHVIHVSGRIVQRPPQPARPKQVRLRGGVSGEVWEHQGLCAGKHEDRTPRSGMHNLAVFCSLERSLARLSHSGTNAYFSPLS